MFDWIRKKTGLSHPPQTPQKYKPTVIHTSTGPCPDGYRLVPGVFIQADGTTEDAYVFHVTDPKAPGVVIDFLRPGESFQIGLSFSERGTE